MNEKFIIGIYSVYDDHYFYFDKNKNRVLSMRLATKFETYEDAKYMIGELIKKTKDTEKLYFEISKLFYHE